MSKGISSKLNFYKSIGTDWTRTRNLLTSGVTGGGQGDRVPPQTSDREIFADVSGKKRQGKKGKRGENLEEKKEKCKREGGKLEMEVGKFIKSGEDLFSLVYFCLFVCLFLFLLFLFVCLFIFFILFHFIFFFFLLFTFENDENLFWFYQNGNFLPGKNISRQEKNQEK